MNYGEEDLQFWYLYFIGFILSIAVVPRAWTWRWSAGRRSAAAGFRVLAAAQRRGAASVASVAADVAADAVRAGHSVRIDRVIHHLFLCHQTRMAQLRVIEILNSIHFKLCQFIYLWSTNDWFLVKIGCKIVWKFWKKSQVKLKCVKI